MLESLEVLERAHVYPPYLHNACFLKCWMQLQDFQEQVGSIQDDVSLVNGLAASFEPPDVLSQVDMERLNDLNRRWRLLQVCNEHNISPFQFIIICTQYLSICGSSLK